MLFFIIDPDRKTANDLITIIKNQISREGSCREVEFECINSPREFPMKRALESDVCIITEICFDAAEGLELAERIRSRSEDIPIVFFTSTNDYAMQCYNLGIDYYALKPPTEENVCRMLKRVREKKESY